MAVAGCYVHYADTETTAITRLALSIKELELLALQRSQSQTAVYSNAAAGPVIHSAQRVDCEVQLMNGFQFRRRALSKTTVLTVACVKYGICGCSDAGCWY